MSFGTHVHGIDIHLQLPEPTFGRDEDTSDATNFKDVLLVPNTTSASTEQEQSEKWLYWFWFANHKGEDAYWFKTDDCCVGFVMFLFCFA